MATFEHILVATDLTEASQGALELATHLARDSGARITVLHAIEVPAHPELGMAIDLGPSIEAAARPKLEQVVRSVRATCPGAAGVLRCGVPWEQIVEVADEVGADVVVLGTHGRRGVAHALVGSVAEHVVRLCPRPVLTVRLSSRKAPGAG